MGLGGVISNLLSLGAKLLPAINQFSSQPSSSSSPPVESHQTEIEMKEPIDLHSSFDFLQRKKIIDMGLGGVISNLRSLGAKLLPAVNQFSLQASSSSSPPGESHQIEIELKKLMELLERIKAMLYDAEEREIRDKAVKLWLKELRGIAYDAEDVLDEYHYQVLRAQVEARDASSPSDSPKLKQVQVPDGMLDQIQQIRRKFAIIAQDRIALQLLEEEAPRHCHSDLQIAPTSHFVVESEIIGRKREKEELIDLLCSESHDGKIISVVTIVGTGGIGKTTLAQLVYNDQRIRQRFANFGWVCVSEDFNVQRLTREVVESITRRPCSLANLSALQDGISEEIRGKRIFLVLDDVWNESANIWESFRKPFMSASLVKILVTTRNETVARIMQTVPTFKLDYMSEAQSWQLFQHYAFGEVVQNRGSNLVEIGKLIVKKCGMLPLAVKSIACLLRLEPEEESWRGILESELWESDARNEIFQPLQISYARLPTYLKPCFLYCSMFPKDYRYSAKELVKLWISQGYVQTDGLKNAEKVGWEYAKQLWQRSFFQGDYMENFFEFTLHDMVHDLARSISGHGCYSIEGDMVPDFPEELYHLYVGHRFKDELAEPPPSPYGKFTTLRTLVMSNDAEIFPSGFNFSEAPKLRALKLAQDICLESLFSFVNLEHLRYLSLNNAPFERLPDCICFLYNLRILTLEGCDDLTELPESLGNLISLEELTIEECSSLKVLPESLCQLKALQTFCLSECSVEELPHDIGNLTNLQILAIIGTNVSSLPPSMGNLTNLRHLTISLNNISSLPPSLNKIMVRIGALKVILVCKTIGWLEDFVDLKGTLWLVGLTNSYILRGFHCANLASMHNLQRLILTWDNMELDMGRVMNGNVSLKLYIGPEGSLISDIISNYVMDYETASGEDHSLMVGLQPHPNLKELEIKCYCGRTFPDWIGNPTSSLESIVLEECPFITFLPFGGLYNLKHLKLEACSRLQSIQEESLPLVLQELKISYCHILISVTGIQKLKSLVKLYITFCGELRWLDHCGDSETCKISTFIGCPRLREWCTQHGISQEGLISADEVHSDFKELRISDYVGRKFHWRRNPILCALLERIKLERCNFIAFLPFGGLYKLKYLRIEKCYRLQFIHKESLPLLLEEIEILDCENLISVTGIQRLKSLVKLDITDCENLCLLDPCGDASIITVSRCPKIRELCSQHGICYKTGSVVAISI